MAMYYYYIPNRFCYFYDNFLIVYLENISSLLQDSISDDRDYNLDFLALFCSLYLSNLVVIDYKSLTNTYNLFDNLVFIYFN